MSTAKHIQQQLTEYSKFTYVTLLFFLQEKLLNC